MGNWMNIHKFLNILALIVFIYIGYLVVVGILWYSCPNSWLTQSLIFSEFKYIYEYPFGVYVEAVKVEHKLEFNDLTIRFDKSSADEPVHQQLLDSQMVIDSNSYSFSKMTPDVLKQLGAEDRPNTNYPNSSTWILQKTMGINLGYNLVFGFENEKIYVVGIHIQHPPDSAKGSAKPVPILFSIKGSEWIQFPINEKDLVRILGKPDNITREPLFP